MTTIAQMLPIKENLLEITRADLGPPHIQLGERVLYKCPFGRCRGHTLVVEPERYYCVGPCQSCGTLEDWQAHFAQPLLHPQRTTAYSRLWQRTAMPVVEQAEEALYSEAATPLCDYLTQIGLDDATIVAARLGFIPGERHEHHIVGPLHIPSGLSIPWLLDGELQAWRVLRRDTVNHFAEVSGGDLSAIYNHEAVWPDVPVLLCNDELEALLVQQLCGDLVAPVCHLEGRQPQLAQALDGHRLLKPVPARKKATYGYAEPVLLPIGYTIIAFHKQGGDLRAWLRRALSEVRDG
jgi:hypothetical protein